jgi:hypothetical protein
MIYFVDCFHRRFLENGEPGQHTMMQIIITTNVECYYQKQQPCNRQTVKSRQWYCRIQYENVGSPFS